MKITAAKNWSLFNAHVKREWAAATTYERIAICIIGAVFIGSVVGAAVFR
jgi:hypothetical protein